MDPKEISEALAAEKFVPRRVTNVPHKEYGKMLPGLLFSVELEPNTINPSIYEHSSLLQVRIKVVFQASLRTTSLSKLPAPRPYKTVLSSLGPLYQVWRGTCIWDLSYSYKCANCNGQHPANYRGCPEFHKLRKTPHRATEEIKRREQTPSSATHQSKVLEKSFAAAIQTSSSQKRQQQSNEVQHQKQQQSKHNQSTFLPASEYTTLENLYCTHLVCKFAL